MALFTSPQHHRIHWGPVFIKITGLQQKCNEIFFSLSVYLMKLDVETFFSVEFMCKM